MDTSKINKGKLKENALILSVSACLLILFHNFFQKFVHQVSYFALGTINLHSTSKQIWDKRSTDTMKIYV